MNRSKVVYNILKISPSFASHTNPGSGTNAFFHSKYSKHRSYILTEDRNLNYLDVSRNVKIKTIRTKKTGLGELGDKKFFLKLVLKFFSTVLFTFKSFNYINKIKPKIVHLYSPIYFFTGLYCKIIYGSKIVMTIHGTDGLRIQNSRLLKTLLNFIDINLSLSNRFIKEINRKDVFFLGNGFDDSIFYLNPKYKNLRRKYIISVGNLRWQKDHLKMIKSFNIFQKDNKEYKLLIVGEGNLRKDIENEILKLNLNKKVFLLGKKNQKYISRLMNISSVFLLTSKSEGSPKVVFEAMSCGLPILSTDVGDIINNINENTGLISNNDINCIAHNLKKIIIKKYDRELISKEIKFKSWKNVSLKLDRIYEGNKK